MLGKRFYIFWKRYIEYFGGGYT